jgi:hypothetical protein
MAFSDAFVAEINNIVNKTDDQLVADAIAKIESYILKQVTPKVNSIEVDLHEFLWPPYSHAILRKIIAQLHYNFCVTMNFELDKKTAYYMKKKSICFLEVSDKSTQWERTYDPCDYTCDDCRKFVIKLA